MTPPPASPFASPGPRPSGPPAAGSGRRPGTTPRTAPGPGRPPAPVVTVGDYTLLSKLGEGGMGIVHLARRPGGDRVALKVLRPHIVGDDEARARLAREVTSLSRIRSRWVAEILDADPWAPIPYVATRYVPGLSLHDHVVEEGPITGPDLLWFARCLAEGVASVHAAGVLHRDVKPSNVLLEGRTPILIDFGLARVADDPRLTHTGWLLGTPGYLAPEILYGDDATTASDVHSWASTVAYAAMGRAPFGRGPSMAIMDRVRRGEHDLGAAPPAVRALLAEALDPEPRRRPGLAQVLARLEASTDPARQAGRAAPAWSADAAEGHDVTEPIALLDPLSLPPGLGGTAPSVAGARPTRVLTTRQPRGQPRDRPRDRPRDEPGLQPGSDYQTDPGEPDPWAAPLYLDPEPARRVGPAERWRRALLLVLLAGLVGVATAAAPWTLAVVVTLVWLLRSGSLAASAAGDRRRVRGRRWYDPVLVLLRAPWDLARSIPATVLLVLWSIGLAVAAALLGYAAAASQAVTLGVVGAAFAVAVWTGPGGSRVRSPLHRALRPLARPWRVWLLVLGALTLLALAGAWLVADRGTSWAPADAQPFAGWRGWLW